MLQVEVVENKYQVEVTQQATELNITQNRIGLDVLGGAVVYNCSGGGNYTHTQAIASTTWTIAHNLNKHPSVTVIDSGGSYMITDITYTNTNTLVLTFLAAVGGIAYLN